MKRSEMIKCLADIIDIYRPQRRTDNYNLAESVLQMAEVKGMLPPHNKLAQEMSGSPHPSIYCCQWSPEK